MIINFAHANGIPSASYQPLFDDLAPHQVINKPKYGHHPNFSPADNWSHLADELLEFVAENADEPVVAVGHSMGAVISYLAACRQPDRFRGVLMLDPPLLWGVFALAYRIARFVGKGDSMTPAGKSKHRRRSWPNRQAANDYFASKKLFNFDPACFAAFCDAAVTDSANGGVELFFDVDIEVEIFRNTPVNMKSTSPPGNLPIKVVYADQSDASRADCIIPFCRYFKFPYQKIQGQHMYPLQQPKKTVQLIQGFLEELDARD